MGGKCFLVRRNADGKVRRRPGPPCTDNFQIVANKFDFNGDLWHSVEQAFQALKFPPDSVARKEINATSPNIEETDEEYGIRVWRLGQHRTDSTMSNDWEENKVKVMLLLNLAKYSSNTEYQTQLMAMEY